MKHLRDQQLVSEAMGFGDARTAAHLTACPDCRERLQAWTRPLAAAASWPAPADDAALSERVWAGIAGRLDSAPPRRFRTLAWSTATALAAALLLVVWWTRPAQPAVSQQPPVSLATATAPAAPSPLLRAAVADHLDQAQLLLVELKHAAPSAGSVDMATSKGMARDLLAANRLYQSDASLRGNHDVAHVLGLLEPPLLEIAHSPNRLDAAAWQRMQSRFASSGLLFKLRVFDQTLTARRQAQSSARNGDL